MQASNTNTVLTFEQPDELAAHLRALGVASLTCDSRCAGPDVAFIAWPGAAVDGRQFVGAAIEQGAPLCVVERAGLEGSNVVGELTRSVVAYQGLKAAAGAIAAAFYAHPSRELDVVAITGTNGKTSCSWWLAQAFGAIAAPYQKHTALVGTLGIGAPASLESTGLTTPDPVRLQSALRAMVNQGRTLCALEASSIGIAEARLDGCQIETAVFTNFSQDHLDYHGSMQAYWAEKEKLFTWSGLRCAVVNIDDAKGAELLNVLGAGLQVWAYSTDECALSGLSHSSWGHALLAQNIHYAAGGLAFDVQEFGSEGKALTKVVLQSNVIGRYNVSNLLAVMAVMRSKGVPLDLAAQVCAHLPAVPGRMELVTESEQGHDGAAALPMVLVDYAHTPDAIEKALGALRPLTEVRGGRLHCLFGCGGNRDASKRPLMARAAQSLADCVVLTSDNPRFEDPERILDDMQAGLVESLSSDQVLRISKRDEAITRVVTRAESADVILIAGKGHEDYQEVQGVKHRFDDRLVARDALQVRAQGGYHA